MLSIATLHAVDYYTKAAEEAFSYYGKDSSALMETDPGGLWTGQLAEQYFGDGQPVTRTQFASLFFGFAPNTGEALTKSADRLGFDSWLAEQRSVDPELSIAERRTAKATVKTLRSQLLERDQGENHRNHRPGIDLTFSAPKDFSLLVAAVSPEERAVLLAAWRRSVESTLVTAEARYAKTRVRDETGALRKERIAGSAIAMFEHLAARPVGGPPDPSVHFHCVMFSPTLGFDNKTRALFSNDLRLNLKVLDAEARARLAQELSRMGYALTEDRQKNCTSFHLAGVRPEERERYSKRRTEILEAMASGQFQSSSVAAIGTRQEKGDWKRSDALAAWKLDFEKIGLTAARIKAATVDAEPHGRTDEAIITQLLAMKSYFSPRELRQLLWEEAQFSKLPENCDIGDWIDARANQLLKSRDLLEAQLPDGSTASRQRTAVGDDDPVFTSRSLLLREIKLDETVQCLGKETRHRIDWQMAKAIVEAQEQSKTNQAKAEALARGKPLPDDFRWFYRDDQKAAIAKILAGPDVGFVQAFAGTGKTTAAAAMIEVYRTQGIEVVALAPSNKAAGQLSEDCMLEGERKALTVDAFLLSKAKDRVTADTVIFVDESSMLSFDHAEALLSLARERGAKVVFQGDKQQLPSVARGRFFANCIEKRLGTEAAELTVITRQREEWAKVATEAAERGDFAKTLALLDEHDAIHTEGTDEAVLDRLVRDHLADPQPAHQKIVVASRNADVAALNKKIRQALVGRGEVSEGLAMMAGKEQKQRLMVGDNDRIIFTDTLKQGRQKIAANGAIGTVQSISPIENGVRIRVLIDGQRRPVEFDSTEFSAIQHAFGVSIHRSQGATLESTRYLFSDFVSSELCTVAFSRHRQSFGLYCRADQLADMPRWMGRRIEKLDARDLVSLETLNESSAALRRQHEGNAMSIRSILCERLPVVFKQTAGYVGEWLPELPRFSLSSAASVCMERLRLHQHRLAEHLVKLGRAAVLPVSILPDQATARAVAPIDFPREAKEIWRPRL